MQSHVERAEPSGPRNSPLKQKHNNTGETTATRKYLNKISPWENKHQKDGTDYCHLEISPVAYEVRQNASDGFSKSEGELDEHARLRPVLGIQGFDH